MFLITLCFSVGNAVGSGLGLSMLFGGSPIMWTVACSVVVAAVLLLRNVYRVIEKILIVIVALGPGGGRGWRDKLWTMAVLPTMHLSWGWGFIVGVLRGAHDTVDTSRLGSRNTPLP